MVWYQKKSAVIDLTATLYAKGKNIDPRPIVLGTRLTWSQSSLLCLQMWKGRSDSMQCICLKISISMSRLVDRSKVSFVKAKSIFCSLNTLKFSVETQSEPQNGFEFDLARPRLYPNHGNLRVCFRQLMIL